MAKLTDHTLDFVKGWPSPSALDKTAPLDSSVTPSEVFAGMCMCLNDSGNLVYGTQFPNDSPGIFVMQNGTDNDVNPYDVTNDQAGSAGRRFGSNGPRLSGIVCLAPVEVQSTEFVSGAYIPGDQLTTVDSGSNKGKVTKGFYYLNPIVGIISALCGNDATTYLKNQELNYVVQFWTYWLPSHKSSNY